MLKFLRKKKQVELFSPCSGKIIPISEVNDPVFSQKLLGKVLLLFQKSRQFMLL
ncbi:PTS glucose transporter subunit IIA [Enterococcus faecium]